MIAGRKNSLLLLLTVVAVGTFIASMVTAQPSLEQMDERFKFTYDFNRFRKLQDPEAVGLDPGTTIEISGIDIAMLLPLEMKNGHTTILNGFTYVLENYGYRNWDGIRQPYRPERMHSIKYQFGVRRRLSRTWTGAVAVWPGLATDFENVDGDHVYYEGALLLSHEISRTRTLGFGVAYTNLFGEPLLLPVFQWVRARSANHKVDVLLPRKAHFIIFPSESVHLTIGATVSGDNYRIGADEAPEKNATLRESSVRVGFQLTRRLSRKYAASIDAGGAFARILQVQDEDDNKLIDLDLKPTPYVRVGVALTR